MVSYFQTSDTISSSLSNRLEKGRWREARFPYVDSVFTVEDA